MVSSWPVRPFFTGILLLVLLSLFACAAPDLPTAVPSASTPENPTAPSIIPASPTPAPVQPIYTATTAASATPTRVETQLAVCSPLEGVALGSLTGMISNPYHPPAPGSDDPHQGVDLAVRLEGSTAAIKGHPVQAVLAGEVVTVLSDRFPYGYAVFIETRLIDLPEDWVLNTGFPTAAPTLELRSALTCPPDPTWEVTGSSGRSLYSLYAHLQADVQMEAGETVSCGERLGTVGDSGNALNPHLHYETRVGPSGLRWKSMAHYDASASSEEMNRYCTWRISGLFQLVDPMKILGSSR